MKNTIYLTHIEPIMELVNKIRKARKKYTFAQIFILVFQKYIFRILLMEKYSIVINQFNLELKETKYTVEIYEQDKFKDIIQTNPYLSQKDINFFTQKNSICIVVKNKDKIIASTWFINNTDYFLEDAKQVINIKKNEYYALRAFTDKRFRGEHLQSYIYQEFLNRVATKNSVIWCLIYSWNKNSIKLLERSGFQREANAIFIMLFRYKFKIFSTL